MLVEAWCMKEYSIIVGYYKHRNTEEFNTGATLEVGLDYCLSMSSAQLLHNSKISTYMHNNPSSFLRKHYEDLGPSDHRHVRYVHKLVTYGTGLDIYFDETVT